MTALVVASSGTAIAAGLVNGDGLIKKHSLSGNRLHNHTITGKQVNVNKLGKVPSAANADHAATAASATTAGTATNATNATNAAALGGAAPSTYEPSAHFVRTGLVTLSSNGSTTLATFAPFTLTFKCNAGTGAGVDGELDASSTVANSVAFGRVLATAGTALAIITDSDTTGFNDSDNNTIDFLTPTGQSYQALVSVGENFPGSAASTCFANASITTS